MNPLLLDFPEEFESERLLVRAPRVGDGVELNALVHTSVEELRPWMPWVTPVPTVEQSEESVRKAIGRWKLREDLRLHLYLKSTGEFIGGSGLHRINWEVPKFEIGYWIGSRFTGKGYITEAVDRIARFAFEELRARRVEIRCDDRNVRSIGVAERAGFLLEGILRNDSRSTGGEIRSTRIYAKIRDEIS
jgi:RimJ/RimL family protein N-acetyltransferase